MELCQPCGIMEKSIGKGAESALRDQGGIRAHAITSGIIRVGDTIEILGEVPSAAAQGVAR
jgi:MOSC domain-containing protein YiiM